MSRSIQRATDVPNLKDLSWFMRPTLKKMNWTLVVKSINVTQMRCRATYLMYIPSFKLISLSMLKKIRKIRTDGQTSFSMNKPTTWCKSGRVSLVSSSCLYKTQPERALAQVCHTRIDALSPDEYQFHLLRTDIAMAWYDCFSNGHI